MPTRSRGWFTNSRFTTQNSRTFFFPPAHYCIYVSCSASEEAYAQEIARLAHTAEGRARLEYMFPERPGRGGWGAGGGGRRGEASAGVSARYYDRCAMCVLCY